MLIDVGTGDPAKVDHQVTREEVLAAAGLDSASVLKTKDRGECVAAMVKAAPVILQQLQKEGRIQGVISLGGGEERPLPQRLCESFPSGFPS